MNLTFKVLSVYLKELRPFIKTMMILIILSSRNQHFGIYLELNKLIAWESFIINLVKQFFLFHNYPKLINYG